MTSTRPRASCVVDASVVAVAFFHEQHAETCRSILMSGRELHAPDLIHAGIANVIWKRCRRDEIDTAEAAGLLKDILRLPLLISPSEGLAPAALQLALRTDRTVYDCLYLALAVRQDTVMVTGDPRLANAVSGSPLEQYVAWVGESPASLSGPVA
jgi:predicted nucleic acid-binding protein